MFGLTVACFVFLAYLVTLDEVDLRVAALTTVVMVSAVNAVVFAKRPVVMWALDCVVSVFSRVGGVTRRGVVRIADGVRVTFAERQDRG